MNERGTKEEENHDRLVPISTHRVQTTLPVDVSHGGEATELQRFCVHVRVYTLTSASIYPVVF